MVVDANLLAGIADALADQMHQIGRAEFAEGHKRFGTGFDGFV